MSYKISDVLNEYGGAIRGDWSDIDGRSTKSDLEIIADMLAEKGNKKLTSIQRMNLRDGLGICLSGLGHWQVYCEDTCVTHEELYKMNKEELND